MRILNKLGKTFRKNNLTWKLNFKNFSSSESNINYKEEWTKLYKEKQKLNVDMLEKELDEYQKKEAQALLSKVTKFNKDEKIYFLSLIKNKLNIMFGTDVIKSDLNYPEILMESQNLWPKENPNWMKSNNMQITVSSFSGTGHSITPGIK
jgi:hypothetical protein